MLSDVRIAQMYVNKANNAHARGLEFSISFSTYKNMMRAKRCKYTGITLTEQRIGAQSHRATDRTIDRIDASKGYINGNCVACSHAANQFKSNFECDTFPLSTNDAKKIIAALERGRA